jgi:DNA sulfur modification protein DndB
MVGKLSPAQSLTGKISRVTFNRAVGSALDSGIALQATPDNRYRLLLNYLNAFDAELVDKGLLTRSAFFEAVFEVFDEVVKTTIANHKNAKQDSLQQVIQPLARLDFSGSGGRAILGKKTIVTLLQTTLRQHSPISAEML